MDYERSTRTANLSYKLIDTGSAINLVVTIPRDFDGNGIVDAADYVTWRKGLGTAYTQSNYDSWRAHIGQFAGSGSGASFTSSVPEPQSLLMLLSLMAILVFHRRDRRIGIGE